MSLKRVLDIASFTFVGIVLIGLVIGFIKMTFAQWDRILSISSVDWAVGFGLATIAMGVWALFIVSINRIARR